MARSGQRVVLITGCSSGIGRSSADLLARRGHTVYATARRAESVEELRGWAAGFDGHAFADQLDVTRPQTIQPVVDRIVAEQGGIDVLVNNAGYGQAGAVEDLSRELWLAQFDANVFGLADVTRAVLPHMRARRRGRIINVSSVVAHVTTPLMGAYCASKHAVEALSTALRIELAPWNIEVVLIEPGPIHTDFGANVDRNRPAGIDAGESAYRRHYWVVERQWEKKLSKRRAPAERVAEAVRRAVEDRRPKTRYRITRIARWLPGVTALLGDCLTDYLMRRTFGLGKINTEE